MNFNERPVNENRMRSRELRSETAANERLAARHNDRGTHHLSEQTKHEKKNLTKKLHVMHVLVDFKASWESSGKLTLKSNYNLCSIWETSSEKNYNSYSNIGINCTSQVHKSQLNFELIYLADII